MVISFTVPGEPVGKGRPRMTKTGHAYTPKRTREYERLVRGYFLESMIGAPRTTLTGPLRVTVEAVFGIPKSANSSARAAMESGRLRPTKKPDLDNIIKVLDALNNVAFADDSQIVEIVARKAYTDRETPEPCVTFTIEEI